MPHEPGEFSNGRPIVHSGDREFWLHHGRPQVRLERRGEVSQDVARRAAAAVPGGRPQAAVGGGIIHYIFAQFLNVSFKLDQVALNYYAGEPKLRKLLAPAGGRDVHPVHGLLHDSGELHNLFRPASSNKHTETRIQTNTIQPNNLLLNQ